MPEEIKKKKILEARLIEETEQVKKEVEVEIEKYEFYNGFYIPMWVKEEKIREIAKSCGFEEGDIIIIGVRGGYIVIIGKTIVEGQVDFKTLVLAFFSKLFDYVRKENLFGDIIAESPYFTQLQKVVSLITDFIGTPDEGVIAKLAEELLKDLLPYEDFTSEETRALMSKLFSTKTPEEFKEAFLDYWNSYSIEIQKIVFKTVFQMSKDVLFINAITPTKTLNTPGIKSIKLFGEEILNSVNLSIEGRRQYVFFSTNGEKKFVVFNQGARYLYLPMIFFFTITWDNAIIDLINKTILIISNLSENTEMELRKSAISFTNTIEKLSLIDLEKIVKILEGTYNLQFEGYFKIIKEQRNLLQKLVFNYRYKINPELSKLMGNSIKTEIREMMADKKAEQTLNDVRTIYDRVSRLSMFYQELNEKIKMLIEAKKSKDVKAISIILGLLKELVFKYLLPS